MDIVFEYSDNLEDIALSNDKPLYVRNAGHYILTKQTHDVRRAQGTSDYQILYLVQGTMKLILNGQELFLHSGSLIIFKPNEPQFYSYLAENATVESYYVHFHGYLAEQIFKDLDIFEYQVANIGEVSAIPELITSILMQLLAKDYGYEYKCFADLLQLLQVCGRELKKIPTYDPKHTKEFLNVLSQLQNYPHWFELEKYAKICHLSVSRFSHLFKQYFGVSPQGYRMEMLIRKAKKYLMYTNMNNEQIAEKLNLNSS